MGSIIENHTDRKEIINLLCILFILGSSFLSYIIPSLKSQIFSIGLTLLRRSPYAFQESLFSILQYFLVPI